MKIVYLSFSRIPSQRANSVHVMKMSAAMSRLGNQVILLTRGNRNRSKLPVNVYYQYGVTRIFKIIRVFFPNIPFGWIIYGVNCIRYILKIQPNLIYARDTFGALLAQLFNIPTIYEVHSVAGGWRDKLLYPLIFKNQSLLKIVVISKALKHLIIDRYPSVDINNVVIAHDGVDLHKYSNVSTPENNIFTYKNNQKVIGYFGSFYKGRGVNLVLEIARHLNERQFILVGASLEEMLTYSNYLLKNNINNVSIHEYIPNKDISYYLKECSILLMPYQNNLEVAGGGQDTSSWMSPLKMFEYMASGRPIISSNLDVLTEVLKHRHNAILVEQDKVSQWISAIEEVFDDSMLRNRISKNAYNDVKTYTWNRRVEKVLLGI